MAMLRALVLAFGLLALASGKGIAEVEQAEGTSYDIGSHQQQSDEVSEGQLEQAEQRAEDEARTEAAQAGADKSEQEAAAKQALAAVRFAAATTSTAKADGSGSSAGSAAASGDGSSEAAEGSGSSEAEGSGSGSGSGASGASGASGSSGPSGNSGPGDSGPPAKPKLPDTPAGSVPANPNNVVGALGIDGLSAENCGAANKVMRGFLATTTGKALSAVEINSCLEGNPGGASGASGGAAGAPKKKGRRLLSLEAMEVSAMDMMQAAGDAVEVGFTVGATDEKQAADAYAALKDMDGAKLVAKLKEAGFDEVTGASLLELKPPTTTTTPAPKAPPGGAAFGISYSWPVIDDAEIDKQAEIVAEWSVRAEYRISQEKNATAAVVGTRQQVIDFATSAHALTGDAIDAKNEPGEEVLRHLEKSQDDTVSAKEARRRLKVLKDYRKAVSAKRKIATTKRDTAIAELLRLKVLRINTAKALWMTLKNKVAELGVMLEKRLKLAQKDAALATQAEKDREPKNVVIAKLEASERAQAAARHVKVYMNAVEYKEKCAATLLAEWQCKVLINCTMAEGAPTGPERPMWSTPTLDALADTMNEAIASYKETKEAIPAVPKKKAPAPPSPVEKRIMKLEKKYGTGEFAPGNQGGACKLEGGRVGHFVKGNCVPFEDEKQIVDAAEVAKDMKSLAEDEEKAAGDKKAADAAEDKEAKKPKRENPADSEGGSDKPAAASADGKAAGDDLSKIEDRIEKLEGDLKK